MGLSGDRTRARGAEAIGISESGERLSQGHHSPSRSVACAWVRARFPSRPIRTPLVGGDQVVDQRVRVTLQSIAEPLG